MARNTIADIAAQVARKHNLGKAEAVNAVAAFFRIISEGLDDDGLVKVRGLGTFKITTVKARESVDVNTGRRVVIREHDKVTFAPDNAMRELVNKPFSQFSTVVVNEGVNFDSVDMASAAEEQKLGLQNGGAVNDEPEEQENEADEAQENDTPEAIDRPDVGNAPDDEPLKEELSEEEPSEEAPSTDEQSEDKQSEDEQSEEEQSEDESSKEEPSDDDDVSDGGHRWLGGIKVCCALLLLLVGLVAGYFIGHYSLLPFERGSVARSEPAAAPADSDTAATGKTAAKAEVRGDTVTRSENVEKQQAGKEKVDSAGYLARLNGDRRLRFGAYEITGVDKVVKLRPGQTMESYSRHSLGKDMIVYFQVLNGVESIGPGDSLKVPRIRLKAKYRRK